MYIFTDTKTVSSKTLPGVEIVFNRMTEKRRAALVLSTSAANARLRELHEEREKLKGTKDPRRNVIIDDISDLISKELNPIKVKWAVKEIKGLQLSDTGDAGRPATLDNIDEWPSELVDEVLEALDTGIGITEKEAKN